VKDIATVRRKPSDADLKRLMDVARATVFDIARMDGALGADAIALLYVQRIYDAIIAGEVRPRETKKRGTA
jgi:hypothetical protein